MATALVAHSGGPTVVINSSLAGVIEECERSPGIHRLLGARYGVNGLIADDLIDLSDIGAATLEAVAQAPGSAIGTCRRSLTPEDYERMMAVFKKHDVRFLFYTGGNGSMDTALRLTRAAEGSRYELHVIGIPKTVDNDILETDHTPGYPSAARFAAFAARDVGEDNRSMPPPVTVLEVIGRNTGWVAAAATLARQGEDDPPHLVYFPERPVSADALIADVERVYRRLGRVLLVVCEGQTDDKGDPFGAEVLDASNARRKLAANLGYSLARLITQRLGIRARAEKPGIVGRSASLAVSAVDREEARLCGRAAVQAGLAGLSGSMISLCRAPGAEYRIQVGSVPLERVAGVERRLPPEWIHPDGNAVLPAFREWALPLTGNIPPIPRFQKDPF